MDLGITGRVALVTGAGGGLGSAIARSLALEGVAVAAADIRLETAIATVEEIEAGGGRAAPLEWDLADPHLVEDRVGRIEQELGAIDILVNNTGGPPPSGALGISLEDWDRHYRSMVLPIFAIANRVVPGMAERGWGRVITSTSSGVISPIPELGISNTLRSALVTWSKTLSREVGVSGVTSNIVLPGRIGTPRIQQLDQAKAKRLGTTTDVVADASVSTIPVGRYGHPDEYGAVVAFLASKPASYITGSIIRVDGGLIQSI